LLPVLMIRMAEPIISLRNACVEYTETGEPVRALDDITLEIYPEEYIIFFGPSGCGKSTLLYLIAGLERPTRGEVTVLGRNLALLSEDEIVEYHRNAVGMIFQAYYLIASLSVRANIALPQIFLGIPKVDRIKNAEALLDRFGILSQKGKVPTQLSGGQQQRVAITRSLINNPSLIFADEPVGNLDSKSADAFLSLLQELNEKDKKTIIMVTHNPNHLGFAHRVFYMKDGKIVREVKNLERTQVREEITKPYRTDELNELAGIFPYLDDEDLKARAVMRSLMGQLPARAEQQLTNLIRRFIGGSIDRDSFVQQASLPLREGGTGLYHASAETLVDNISAVLGMSRFLKKNFGNFPRSYEEYERILERVSSYLLLATTAHFAEEQLKRLRSAIKGRMEGSLNKNTFRNIIDAPATEGGVGLNIRTAQTMTDRFELILVDYEPLTPPPSPKPAKPPTPPTILLTPSPPPAPPPAISVTSESNHANT